MNPFIVTIIIVVALIIIANLDAAEKRQHREGSSLQLALIILAVIFIGGLIRSALV